MALFQLKVFACHFQMNHSFAAGFAIAFVAMCYADKGRSHEGEVMLVFFI